MTTFTQTSARTAPAIDLFALGYRVRAGVDPLTLVVRNPDGVRYTVSPVTNCCSCPAGVKGITCKHLRCLRALVTAQHSQVLRETDLAAYNHYEDEMYSLMLAWDAILAARRAPASVAGVGADGWARLSNMRAA